MLKILKLALFFVAAGVAPTALAQHSIEEQVTNLVDELRYSPPPRSGEAYMQKLEPLSGVVLEGQCFRNNTVISASFLFHVKGVVKGSSDLIVSVSSPDDVFLNTPEMSLFTKEDSFVGRRSDGLPGGRIIRGQILINNLDWEITNLGHPVPKPVYEKTYRLLSPAQNVNADVKEELTLQRVQFKSKMNSSGEMLLIDFSSKFGYEYSGWMPWDDKKYEYFADDKRNTIGRSYICQVPLK